MSDKAEATARGLVRLCYHILNYFSFVHWSREGVDTDYGGVRYTFNLSLRTGSIGDDDPSSVRPIHTDNITTVSLSDYV
jgi:hypothetical protein